MSIDFNVEYLDLKSMLPIAVEIVLFVRVSALPTCRHTAYGGEPKSRNTMTSMTYSFFPGFYIPIGISNIMFLVI